MGSVDFEVKDFVGHILINNPDKLNAVEHDMAGQFWDIYDEIDRRDDVRVAVISGAGTKAFSVGGNIPDYIAKGIVGSEGSGKRTVLPKPFRNYTPFIAAIEGYCVGGGFPLALACDIRIGGETTKIGASGLKRGVVNAGTATTRLVRLVGLGNAMEALLTSEYMDAAKAYRIGLLQRVVPQGQALQTAMEMAQLIAGYSPEAVAGTKRLAYDGLELTWQQSLDWEEAVMSSNYQTPDAGEGYLSFTEKRDAVFGQNTEGMAALEMDEHWPLDETPEWK